MNSSTNTAHSSNTNKLAVAPGAIDTISSASSSESGPTTSRKQRVVQQHQPYLPRPVGGSSVPTPTNNLPPNSAPNSSFGSPTMNWRNHLQQQQPTTTNDYHQQQQFHHQHPQQQQQQGQGQGQYHPQGADLPLPLNRPNTDYSTSAQPRQSLTYYHHAYWQMQQQQLYQQQHQQYQYGGARNDEYSNQHVWPNPSAHPGTAPVDNNTYQQQGGSDIIRNDSNQAPVPSPPLGFDQLPEYADVPVRADRTRHQNQQHRKISSSSSENTSNPPSSGRSPASSLSKRELRQAQQQLPFPDCCHHRSLVEKMEFVLPPKDLLCDAGNLPPNSNPEQFYRLFLGQCRFETKPAELRWLLHYLGKIQPVKVEQRGRGAFMAFLKTEAELQTLLHVLTGRVLFDYTGVWYARSEEQADLLRSYVDKYASHSTPSEHRAARLPKDLVVLRDQQEAEELQALGPVQAPLHWVPPRSE